MKRASVIAILKGHERDIRARGARSLYLFGSGARGEVRKTSDIDLFMEYRKNRKFSLIDLVDLQHYLEDILHRKVDLFTRDGLHRTIRATVEAEAVKVF